MYLVGVDFSENNLLTEQLNVRSFYDLPVLNCSLCEHQLRNFSDAQIKEAYLIDIKKDVEFSLYKTIVVDSLSFSKYLFMLEDKEKILLYRNDVYFEFDVFNFRGSVCEGEPILLTDTNGFGIALLCSVSYFKKIYSKSINLQSLINNGSKHISFSAKVNGYTKVLNNVKNYKNLLFDILNGKTAFKPPHIAAGIFTDSNVPKGDFSIVPPVYLGENVQIESGSVIGPNTVIYDNSLISTNTSVRNSILFENVFVSSNCYIDGSVCCDNCSVKRNSAVFSGSVLGQDSLIGEDVTVENNSLIKKGVRYDEFVKSPFTSELAFSFKNKFQGLAPDKSALLGSAVASVFNKPKVLIASDGAPNSLCVKLAFMSGLIASGAECFDIGVSFKSHIFFSSLFCECDYSVFISGKGGGTDIEIYNEKNEPLNRAQCCNLFDFCNKGEFLYVSPDECKNIRQIHGMRRMYIREITALFEGIENFDVIISCKNNILLKTLEDIFKKTANSSNCKHKIYVNINANGTRAMIKFNNKVFSDRELKRLVSFYLKSNSENYVFESCYYKNLWKKDSVFLLFAIFYIIKKTGKNINELVGALPEFYISSKNVSYPLKKGETAKKISDFNNCFYKEDSYNLMLDNNLIKIEKNDDNKLLKVICASENMSVSMELCDFISRLFEDI